jgi:hypothetical protein
LKKDILFQVHKITVETNYKDTAFEVKKRNGGSIDPLRSSVIAMLYLLAESDASSNVISTLLRSTGLFHESGTHLK